MLKIGEAMPNPTYAYQAVARAVKKGVLPELDGTVPCVDCGKPAINYDHRDYDSPLDVEPLCSKCNHRRGPAKGMAPPGKPCFDGELPIRMTKDERELLEKAAKVKSLQLSTWARSELVTLARKLLGNTNRK
jgi:hypothetical protein